MKKYTITKVSEDFSWENIPVINIDFVKKNPDPTISAFGQICYGENDIFVHLWAIEKDIRAEEKIPYGFSCEDSCLEFFFCPLENDNRYFNIEFSPTGCMYLGTGSGLCDLLRIVPDYTDELFEQKITYTDDGWDITYHVPFSFIRRFFPEFEPASGKIIRANLYKCGDKTKNPHYLEWNEVKSDPFTFHAPEYFGTMIFE